MLLPLKEYFYKHQLISLQWCHNQIYVTITLVNLSSFCPSKHTHDMMITGSNNWHLSVFYVPSTDCLAFV